MRNTIMVVTLTAWTASWPHPAEAHSGGPDRYGYEWVDSLEKDEGAVFSWLELPLENRKPVADLGDDDESDWIDLGFSFSFYGKTYDRAVVGSNGYLSFQTNPEAMGPSDQCPLPVANEDPKGPNLAIYGFYQDLNPSAGDENTQIYYATIGAEPQRQLVVTFESIPFYEPGENPVPRGRATFQIVLQEGSNEIQVNVAHPGELRGRAGPANSAPVMIGVEDGSGSSGIGRCEWTDDTPMPGESYSVHFRFFEGLSLLPQQREVLSPPGRELAVDLELRNFSPAETTLTFQATSAQGWPVRVIQPTVAAPGRQPDAGPSVLKATVVGDIPLDARGSDQWKITATDPATEETNATAQIEIFLSQGTADWHNLAELPDSLGEVQLVAAEGVLYALGGESIAIRKDSGAVVTPVDTTYHWTGGDNRWDECGMPSLPLPATRGDACAMGGKIYYVGGVTGDEHGTLTAYERLLTEMLVYDIAENKWTTVEGPPTLVAEGTVVCHEEAGRLFIYGGYADVDHNGLLQLASDDAPDNMDTTVPLFQSYDVQTDTWRDDLPVLGTAGNPQGRARAAMALVDGTIYLAGGSNRVLGNDGWSTYYYSAGYSYSPGAEQWTSIAWIPKPNGEPLGVAFRGQFCIIGGAEASGGPVASWHCYVAPQWVEQEKPFSFARYDMDATVMGDHLYVAGGVARGATHAVDRVERWPATATSPPMPPILCRSHGGDDPGGEDNDALSVNDEVGKQVTVDEPTISGCQCASAGTQPRQVGLFAVVLLLGLAWLRRSKS